jgi:hypothetical protein
LLNNRSLSQDQERSIYSSQIIATAKTVRTFLIAETIAITASSFFLLPSSFFLLLELTLLAGSTFLEHKLNFPFVFGTVGCIAFWI